jgi:hypothetical protein
MQKNSKSWNGLSKAQQASIADIIAKKKESYRAPLEPSEWSCDNVGNACHYCQDHGRVQ